MVLTGIADFTLGQQGLTAKDCDRLLALLAEHEREAVSLADEGLRMEYISCAIRWTGCSNDACLPAELADAAWRQPDSRSIR